MVPFSGKQLGNHTPHTGYGPSHSWLMRRAPQPKKGLHSGANQTDLPPPLMTIVDGQDLPTCLIIVDLRTTRHVTTFLGSRAPGLSSIGQVP
jgi:hypothetical protein